MNVVRFPGPPPRLRIVHASLDEPFKLDQLYQEIARKSGESVPEVQRRVLATYIEVHKNSF